MASIIVQMISIITVIAITGEAVDLQTDKDFKETCGLEIFNMMGHIAVAMLYEKINNHEKTLRVAISSDVSCDGLSDILYNTQMIHQHNKGSMLLIFNKTKHDATTTTTESIQSISKRYERRGYILQNFGNRPNPFWRKEETKEEKDRRRRHVLQMSDGDDRHSAVIDLANSNGLQLNANAKDISTATIKDKNWLRQPLEIKNLKLRRKRSVTSTSKTNVTTVLAGVNPFTLMLSNRIHNNNTDKDIIARNVASAYSGNEDSEDYVQNYNPNQSRSRKPAKKKKTYLPISTMRDLSEVERLLHPDSIDFIRNKEDLIIMHKYKLKLPFTF
ncbi:hypothetical protein ACI65C_004968 [Semiaphis heraclei]